MHPHKTHWKSPRYAAVIIAATAALGMTVPLASASTTVAPPPPPGIANAEWLNKACDVPSDHDPDVTEMIYAIGEELGVDDKTMLSAFEAGWVESHMNNLDCGDADSVGVFQQRPSQGWCDDAADCMDVDHATRAYFEQAIPNNEANPDYTAGELAQSVQRSAYPDRYDEAESKAQELIDEVATVLP